MTLFQLYHVHSNVHTQTGYLLTPLMVACLKGHDDVAEALMQSVPVDQLSGVRPCLLGRYLVRYPGCFGS